MGIPKTSRKGKKAWRKNIDAAEVETFLAEESHKAARQPAVETLKDEDLFVVDKEADDSAVPAVLRKKKGGRKEPKPLRSQLILQGLRDGMAPIAPIIKKKIKGQGRPLPNSMAPAAAAAAADAQKAAAAGGKKKKRKQREPVTDLWAEQPDTFITDWAVPVPEAALLKASKQQQQQQQQAAPAAAAAAAAGSAKRSKRTRPAAAPIRAVQVDMPGCSFNPEPEAHQDAIAVAVAAEYKKQLKQELAPKAPSLFAPEGYRPADELDGLLVDAEASEEEEDGRQAAAAAADENEIALDDDDSGDEAAGTAAAGEAAPAAAVGMSCGAARAAAAAAARKTQKDRNREVRRRQHGAELAAKQALKQQRRQLEALPLLQQQLEQEEAERAAVRQRREVVRQEKAAQQPPRLGKHKYEAAAPAVLTTAEVTGSLRQLAPCFLVTAERFKSLQQRGLVEPRRPAGRKQGKRLEYVTGERREKAEERQQEVADLVAARKKAKKGGAAAAAAGSKGKGKGKGKGNADVMPLAV